MQRRFVLSIPKCCIVITLIINTLSRLWISRPPKSRVINTVINTRYVTDLRQIYDTYEIVNLNIRFQIYNIYMANKHKHREKKYLRIKFQSIFVMTVANRREASGSSLGTIYWKRKRHRKLIRFQNSPTYRLYFRSCPPPSCTGNHSTSCQQWCPAVVCLFLF